MRILVGTDQWFPDFRGGSARVATETARGLARRGHDVTVLAPRAPGQPDRVVEGSLTILRAGRRGPFPQTVADTFDPIRHGRELRRQRFDATLAHHATVATGLRLARVGTPHIFVFHASPVRELRFRRSRLPRGWQRLTTYGLDPPLVALERVAVRRAQRVLVLSEFSRSLLRSDHPSVAESAIRVPGGVDVEVFSPGDGRDAARERLGLPADRPLLLTVRRLAERMGLEELLQAVKELGPEGPMLAVVGSGVLESKLRRLSASLGLEGQVRFVGQAGDDELPDWYRAASLFVLPTIAYEGFGMATVESLACGTPVVGTAVGATAELLTPLEPRLVAESAEPRVLAEAIERGLALADGGLRERARAYALERYSWDSVSEEWEAALRKALAS
jgi:glycosyltransferase involved in cell wall biosynthesis